MDGGIIEFGAERTERRINKKKGKDGWGRQEGHRPGARYQHPE